MSRNDADAKTTLGIAGEDPVAIPAASTKSAFQQLLASDAALFLNDEEFAESVVYIPHVGTEVTINAVVDRAPIRVKPGAGGQATRQVAQGVIEIYIANDATLGRASITERFDRVTLAEQQGGSTMKTVRV